MPRRGPHSLARTKGCSLARTKTVSLGFQLALFLAYLATSSAHISTAHARHQPTASLLELKRTCCTMASGAPLPWALMLKEMAPPPPGLPGATCSSCTFRAMKTGKKGCLAWNPSLIATFAACLSSCVLRLQV